MISRITLSNIVRDHQNTNFLMLDAFGSLYFSSIPRATFDLFENRSTMLTVLVQDIIDFVNYNLLEYFHLSMLTTCMKLFLSSSVNFLLAIPGVVQWAAGPCKSKKTFRCSIPNV